LIRGTKTKNFQEMIDNFMDCPENLITLLKRTNFL
jgi:hypothetical protein